HEDRALQLRLRPELRAGPAPGADDLCPLQAAGEGLEGAAPRVGAGRGGLRRDPVLRGGGVHGVRGDGLQGPDRDLRIARPDRQHPRADPLPAVERRHQAVGARRGDGLPAGVRGEQGTGGQDDPPGDQQGHLRGGDVRDALARPNVLDGAAFRKALQGACERAGALTGGPAALVLPDPAIRVALLPAAELKARRRAEVEQMIRFRLNKTVPFDVQEARVSWAGPEGGQMLVAAVFRPVLEGYEAALRDLGFEPGVVEPASLALVGTLERAGTPGDRLLVNWDVGYVSLVLTRRGWPILIRTLVGDLGPEAVLRE